jgi:hypothetical protein
MRKGKSHAKAKDDQKRMGKHSHAEHACNKAHPAGRLCFFFLLPTIQQHASALCIAIELDKCTNRKFLVLCCPVVVAYVHGKNTRFGIVFVAYKKTRV